MNTDREAFSEESATAVVVRRIHPEKTEVFEEMLLQVNSLRSRFEGHLGTTVVRPREKDHLEYIIVIRFRDAGALRGWTESEELADWMAKAEDCTLEKSVHQKTGLETWFNLPGRPPTTAPSRVKMALAVFLAIYPLVQILNLWVGPALAKLELAVPLDSVIPTALMVVTMTWVVMPAVTWLLWPWLHPGTPRP
jgi:antibiotic biosynthesis monooxygenase (ABM) superfamily enzyme